MIVGWDKFTGTMVVNVNMDFTSKTRWVFDGHRTAYLEGSLYAGFVLRESIRIALTYAEINGLNVVAAEIRNVYLQVPSSQKDYIICGTEFVFKNVGSKALLIRELYGGKYVGHAFINHVRECMHHLNFESCPTDTDVWMISVMKADGLDYYENVLLYTDNALVINEIG